MIYRVYAERTIESCRYTTDVSVEIDKFFESLQEAFQCVLDYMRPIYSSDYYQRWHEYKRDDCLYYVVTSNHYGGEYVRVSIKEVHFG